MNTIDKLERGEIFSYQSAGNAGPSVSLPPPPPLPRLNPTKRQQTVSIPNYQSTSNPTNPLNDARIGQSSQPSDDAEKMKDIQNAVNDVTQILQSNINKVLERGTRIDTINERSELLNSHTNEFRISSRATRRKYWWQNARFMIILGLVIVVILLAIIWNKRQLILIMFVQKIDILFGFATTCLLLSSLTSVAAKCVIDSASVKSYSATDGLVITKVGVVATFRLGCDKANLPELYAEVAHDNYDHKPVSVVNVPQRPDLKSVSFVEDLSTSKSRWIEIKVYDDTTYQQIVEARLSGKKTSQFVPLKSIFVSHNGVRYGSFLRTETMAALTLIGFFIVAHMLKSKITN